MCRGFPFGLQKLKGLSGKRLAGAAPARRRAQGEDVSVYVRARARCKYESNFPVCSFFLSVSGSGGPGGVVGRPGRRLRGRTGAEAGVRMVGASSESLFHIPGVRTGEKTVGSMPSMLRCRLRERVALWPGTSVQEAGQAGRGRGAEGRLPALEWWGRGRGAAASPGHCAPADFHGRLPRSRRRRPGAGHSPGFKRHSRNVNNSGGRASERERAPGPPTLSRGQPIDTTTLPFPSTCRKLFPPLLYSSTLCLQPGAGRGPLLPPRLREPSNPDPIRRPVARSLFRCRESERRLPRELQLLGLAVLRVTGTRSLPAWIACSLSPALLPAAPFPPPHPALPLPLSPDCFSNALT